MVSIFLVKEKARSSAERKDGKGDSEDFSARERYDHLSKWECGRTTVIQ